MWLLTLHSFYASVQTRYFATFLSVSHHNEDDTGVVDESIYCYIALLQSGIHCRKINLDLLSFSALSSVLWGLSCVTLPIVNVNTLPSLCHYAPLIRLRHTALYKCVFDLIWYIPQSIWSSAFTPEHNPEKLSPMLIHVCPSFVQHCPDDVTLCLSCES